MSWRTEVRSWVVYAYYVGDESYVGCTCNFRARQQEHTSRMNNTNSKEFHNPLYSAMRQNMEWSVEVLWEKDCLAAEAYIVEKECVEEIQPTLNQMSGGDGGSENRQMRESQRVALQEAAAKPIYWRRTAEDGWNMHSRGVPSLELQLPISVRARVNRRGSGSKEPSWLIVQPDDKTLYPIAEIFTSLQGEGLHTGTPCTFVRLAGCNLNCSFGGALKCDDLAHKNPPKLMSWHSIRGSLSEARHVVVTGGEPSMHLEVEELICRLQVEGKYVQVETNGLNMHILRGANFITHAPKKGGSKPLQGFNEVKLLVGGDYMPSKHELKLYRGIQHKYLSPVNHEKDINAASVSATLKLLETSEADGWKLSMQTHKILKVR